MNENAVLARIGGDTAARLLRLVELTRWSLDEVLAYALEEGVEKGPWSDGSWANDLPVIPDDVKARETGDLRVGDEVVDPDYDLGVVVDFEQVDGEPYAVVASDWQLDSKGELAEFDSESCFSCPVGLLRLAVLLP